MSFTGSVVIVNFNSGEHLAECLKSVAAYTPEARVVVIDNASSDGSDRVAEARPDRVTLHRNEADLGFARGVNQGLALVSGDLVLVLNPDCCLLPGAVELLAAELAQTSRVRDRGSADPERRRKCAGKRARRSDIADGLVRAIVAAHSPLS